jgi:hypothetical protein
MMLFAILVSVVFAHLLVTEQHSALMSVLDGLRERGNKEKQKQKSVSLIFFFVFFVQNAAPRHALDLPALRRAQTRRGSFVRVASFPVCE